MPDWLQRLLPEGWTMAHLIWVSAGLFVVSLIGSLLFVGYILVHLPVDFLVAPPQVSNRSVAARIGIGFIKNLFGVFLVLLGIVMSLPGVPGQGILTILIGIMFLDLPGFRRLERWMLSRRRVFDGVNALRRRYKVEPLLPREPATTTVLSDKIDAA